MKGGPLMDGGSGEITSETMNRKMYKYKSMAESERGRFLYPHNVRTGFPGF